MNRQRLAREIRALLVSKKRDGTPRFSARDVRAFLFIAFATLGPSAAPDGLTPEALQAIGLEAIAIGLRPSMSPEEIARRIREHYRASPIDPVLMREIDALIVAATADSYRPTRRAAQLIGA